MTTLKITGTLAMTLTFLGVMPIIDGETLMPLGLVAAGVLMAIKIAWRVSAKLTKLTNRLDNIENRQEQLDRRKKRTSEGEGGSDT